MTRPSRRELESRLDNLTPDDGTPAERTRTALWASLKDYYDAPLSTTERRALLWFNDDTNSEGER